jgi:hypothetical protein
VNCRFCLARLATTFVDLGMQPLSNAYVIADYADRMEPFYPLHARVCAECFLVQVPELQSPAAIFGNYPYLSSMSDSWLAHCQHYAHAAVRRFGLTQSSLVVEVASNDGYLLRFFKDEQIPVFGIEPAANVAAIATAAGIPTLPRFFGTTLAQELAAQDIRADLLIGNNVLAHVPNLNDFVTGLSLLLAPHGVLTMEFPHLARLIEHNQFDTIYHEHFSYFSFGTVERVFHAHGLSLFDVDELSTHGGSLRVYACHASSQRSVTPRVRALLAAEEAQGLRIIGTYTHFAERARVAKRNILAFLIDCKRKGQQVVAYGAAAKGNTLRNYCGVRTDFIDYAADRSPLKQGKLMPGTHIPVVAPERIHETKPDWVLLLAWNIKDEISQQLAFVRNWGGQLVVPIPTVETLH